MYSGNPSRMKTFANFVVSGQFVKVLTAKIFIEYVSVIVNGRVIVISAIHESFNRENPTFSNSRKFSPAKDSRHICGMYNYPV